MALLPLLLNDPLAHYRRPSRIPDQHFGVVLTHSDMLSPPPRDLSILTRCPAGYRCPAAYVRPWRTTASERDSGSTLHFDKDRFHANLDVQQFSPEEITVKVTGERQVTVEGKHEEKEDEHGYISRQFVRKYVLPKEYDISRIESKLSSDGVLTLSAPKVDQKEVEHKTVPITHTGQPVKSVEGKEKPKK